VHVHVQVQVQVEHGGKPCRQTIYKDRLQKKVSKKIVKTFAGFGSGGQQ